MSSIFHEKSSYHFSAGLNGSLQDKKTSPRNGRGVRAIARPGQDRED
jgi:hypothetical protein